MLYKFCSQQSQILRSGLLFWVVITAVSYTHLDVYKRQEYDSARAFERAGADVTVKVMKNQSASDIRESVEAFEKAIGGSQIVMFPGGFSAGDEPEGSAKFFATMFRNAKMKEAIEKLLNERDGLMLGICNGFQALIKLGLVPYGEIRQQTPDSPTLTMNTVGRHISKMVYLKVVTNKSPWLQGTEPVSYTHLCGARRSRSGSSL